MSWPPRSARRGLRNDGVGGFDARRQLEAMGKQGHGQLLDVECGDEVASVDHRPNATAPASTARANAWIFPERRDRQCRAPAISTSPSLMTELTCTDSLITLRADTMAEGLTANVGGLAWAASHVERTFSSSSRRR